MVNLFISLFLVNFHLYSIQEINVKYNIDLYPNPANEFINIKIKSDLEVDDFQFSIHSLIGNEMLIVMDKVSDNEVRFDINNYNNGYYFVFINNQKDNKRKILKFSKN